ncbi:Pin3p NDAI_0B05920 [Naumovozyma dairenensis CBS 421]|uniref:SH3 domain-containing protein n=1 Tax=Naumovozyma dairenensis (strain ATCC 10597 / BCRC 20456 / CBS 421 / NBRC 0211 / NRRL Y-12639) TaxID=1071378 RepID=G0W763_NAUDC|nr:hypothetical protein NDAI_0B05920 [Naumovozyma dairenensis CBS 421]CCD23624.1 hypothetical protein NDAI_0B05920 [Naumovozyma dairenensis CBS 421]
MSASLINRSLTNIRTELDFLKESNVISEETFNQINNQLPQRYDPNGSRESVSSQAPTLEYVEAIYPFEPQQEGDLALKAGDKIQVIEKPSPEWFKGKCNGQVGIFPSNYVRPAFSGTSQPSKTRLTPGPPQYQASVETQSIHSSSNVSYQPPFPPASTNYYQQPAQQPQAQYIPPPQPVQQVQQQVQQQPQQQQPQQQHHHHTGEHLKKFGSKLGNAAIFGAGATIGSDIVNSIF